MASVTDKFKDPQFKTTMLPRGFMVFARQCFVFQFIGMCMFGARCLDVIILNKENIKEVDQKK